MDLMFSSAEAAKKIAADWCERLKLLLKRGVSADVEEEHAMYKQRGASGQGAMD